MLNELVGIDLHSHSTASDGTLSPNELVKRAFENGCTVLALTDHDCIDGLIEANFTANQYGMKFISGRIVSFLEIIHITHCWVRF